MKSKFEKFRKTGSINDYLEYALSKRSEKEVKDDRRDNPQNGQVPRKF